MKYLLGLSLLFLVSCVDEVKDGFPTVDPSFGISLLLADDGRNISAVVFASGPVNGTTPLEKVQQAKVLLWENDSLIDSLIYNPQTCYFEGNTKPLAGNKYQCKAYLLNGTVLSASTELPENTPILNWEILPQMGETSDGRRYSRLTFTIPVNKDKTHFYELVIRYSAKGSDSTVYSSVYETEKAYHSCEFADVIDPVLKHEDIINKVLFSTVLMKEETYTMQVNFFNSRDMNDVYVILRSTSKEYYEFARSVDRYEQGRFPDILENPLAYALYSNVENGRGVFCGYSVQQIGPIKGLYEY